MAFDVGTFVRGSRAYTPPPVHPRSDPHQTDRESTVPYMTCASTRLQGEAPNHHLHRQTLTHIMPCRFGSSRRVWHTGHFLLIRSQRSTHSLWYVWMHGKVLTTSPTRKRCLHT